jgi:LysR family glycine cleavage system transcriptional activator
MFTAIWTDALPPSKIDLEIRQGNGSWPGFRATKLHDDHAVAVYGPSYLEQYGASDTAELARRPRVQVLGFEDTWRRFLQHEAGSTNDARIPPGPIAVDTSIAALDIVANSDLWTIVPERFARQSVRSGRVLQATGPTVPMRQGHYLLRRDNAERITGESLAFERWLLAEDAADPGL